MKITPMLGRTGRPVANQYIISEEGHGANGNFIKKEVFQSYQSVIAERITWNDRIDITLDKRTYHFENKGKEWDVIDG